MKNKIHMAHALFKNRFYVISIIILWLIPSTILFATPNAYIYTGEPLTLTPREIAKLQQLFKPIEENVEPKVISEHEHIIWDQTPIDIILPVERERMITFPTSIQFGYDKEELSDGILRVQNNNGVLYFKAKKEFSPQRVEVKCVDTGKIILLNLSARQHASDVPLDVVISSPLKQRPSSLNDENEDNKNYHSTTPVTLIRFAAQQLYSPKRLLSQPSDIYRVPMKTYKTIPLLLDKSAMAMPLASWRGGDLFVTAVLLRNLLAQSISLNPQQICGIWQTASFFPLMELAPRGNAKDSTTLFLVSKHPFADCLKECSI